MTVDLSALGLSQLEEAIYRWLVQSGRSSLSEIAGGIGAPSGQVRSAVATLTRRALLVQAPGRPARFSASPPELALESLLVEHHQALEQTRLEVRRLQELFRGASERRNPAELTEIVEGGEAVRLRVDQLWRAAREEILAFDKPPYAIPPEENLAEERLLASGVVTRGVYSKESLDWPGGLEQVQRFVESGEQARFFPRVPMKLNIIDRRVALIPLAEGERGVDAAIIVHSSHLLDALVALWQTIWDRAFPMPLGRDRPRMPEEDDLDLSEEDTRLVTLLLSGTKSRTIARQMNIGLSTVERRLKRLMGALGVETRFQAGYELGRRGFGLSGGSSEEIPDPE